MEQEMVCVRMEVEAGAAAALGRLFESYGCRVVERADDHLRVGFPGVCSEGEALMEARLYLSMRPSLRRASRPTAVWGARTRVARLCQPGFAG
jgi:hypothetical protein